MHPRLTTLQPRHLAFVSVFRCFEVLIFQTRFVNPLGSARPLKRLIGPIRPPLAGFFQPFPARQCAGLLCPTLLRVLGVGPLEPRRRIPVVDVQAALGNHQVSMGIHPATVDSQRIGQSLTPGKIGGEARGHLTLLPIVQLSRQRKLDLDKQPSVGPFVFVCRRPILPGGVLGPSRHISGFAVREVLRILRILPFALDVVRLRQGGLTPDPAACLHIEVIDSHSWIHRSYCSEHAVS